MKDDANRQTDLIIIEQGRPIVTCRIVIRNCMMMTHVVAARPSHGKNEEIVCDFLFKLSVTSPANEKQEITKKLNE